jgi:hypothetical protein
MSELGLSQKQVGPVEALIVKRDKFMGVSKTGLVEGTPSLKKISEEAT